MFVSAEQSFLFLFLCPLLLLLTFQVSEVTGKKHFLIEVEDAETESTDADNGAVVGSEEEVDGDGQDYGLDGLDGQPSEEDSKKKKGEVKVGAAEFQSNGTDYGDSPVGEIPDLGADFKSAYVPVDASVPIVHLDSHWNCPCLQKCKIEDTKCAKDCNKKCESQLGKDYALTGQKPSKLNKKHSKLDKKPSKLDNKPSKLNKKPSKGNRKPSKLNRKPSKLNRKSFHYQKTLNNRELPKLNKTSGGADYGDSPVGEIPDLGTDFKSAYVPVDASVPIILNENNFETGMNCPCFALRKCDEKKRKSKREKCVADCAKSCQ